MSGHHGADAGAAAVGVADHGEPFERQGGPGTGAQEALERLTRDTQLETKERDPDTRVSGTSAVLPGAHVGGGMRIEEPLPPEPADHPAANPLGERGQVCGGERSGGEEGRWPVGAVRARQEDAVGDGRVELGVAVEPRAEAVEKGAGAEPWAGGRRRGLLIAAEPLRAAKALRTEQRLDLIQHNPRHRRDGFGAIAEHSPQPLGH